MAHLPSGDDLYAVVACYSAVHDLQSRLIAATEVNVEHATIQPPALHVAFEVWTVAPYGVVKDAHGYEMVPLRGRAYDPLTRPSGAAVRRYALRVTPPQIRTIEHLCRRHIVGVPYDLVALLVAYRYEHQHPRTVDRWATAKVAKFDCCAAVTALGRMAGVPILADWLIGTPPMLLAPRQTTPAAVETWLSHNADPFDLALAA